MSDKRIKNKSSLNWIGLRLNKLILPTRLNPVQHRITSFATSANTKNSSILLSDYKTTRAKIDTAILVQSFFLPGKPRSDYFFQ
jgi:hypothetical protein